MKRIMELLMVIEFHLKKKNSASGRFSAASIASSKRFVLIFNPWQLR
jgi:hypothetical protein